MFERLSEQLAVVATIDPDAYGTTTLTTDVFDMSVHHEAMFVILVGENAGTVDFDVQESTATGSGTVTATAVASITQLTAGDDDVQVIVTVRGEDMTEGYRYLRGVLTLSAATDAGVVALADRARYKAASVGDLASVDEIVNA
ncbi:MAG: hypothetical protein GWN58_47375 [Anaerolineae bacterium]|nr:hypothetical protein [Anaerolineae bacterium]